MKLNTFIYIIVIFNQFVLYSQVDNDSLLEWNTRKLKIEDFKLEYDIPEEIERMELQYSEFKLDSIRDLVAAYSSISIYFYPDNEINVLNFKDIEIKTTFRKRFSRIIINHNYVLPHEQLHFDIYEVYAKKMRNRHKELVNRYFVNNYKISEWRKAVNEFIHYYNAMLLEALNLNMEFDSEWLMYSADEEERKKLILKNWRLKIDKMLGCSP